MIDKKLKSIERDRLRMVQCLMSTETVIAESEAVKVKGCRVSHELSRRFSRLDSVSGSYNPLYPITASN